MGLEFFEFSTGFHVVLGVDCIIMKHNRTKNKKYHFLHNFNQLYVKCICMEKRVSGLPYFKTGTSEFDNKYLIL